MKKTVGILGGMGPAASADFYRRVVEATSAACDQDHLHLVIDSCPCVPDRTAYLLGVGADPTPALIALATGLERFGAELLVMPCNSASVFAPRVRLALTVPLLDWVSEVVARIGEEQKIRTLGLLATTGTVKSEIYQIAFAEHSIKTLVPAPFAQERLMAVIYGPGSVKAGSTAKRLLRRQVREVADGLIATGADAILFACTELSVLFAGARPRSDTPVLDASQLVAERIVILAGGTLKVAAA